MKIVLKTSVSGALKANKDYIWFPSQQIIVAIDTNACYQIRQNDDDWYIRMNRKNPWYPLSDRRGGPEFVKLIEPHYVKFLNGLMTNED